MNMYIKWNDLNLGKKWVEINDDALGINKYIMKE